MQYSSSQFVGVHVAYGSLLDVLFCENINDKNRLTDCLGDGVGSSIVRTARGRVAGMGRGWDQNFGLENRRRGLIRVLASFSTSH